MHKCNTVQKKCILVTGGLGYIGSIVVAKLLENKYDVYIVDNLSNSDIKVLDILNNISNINNKTIAFSKIDILNENSLEKIFEECKLYGVIHLAGKKSVKESMSNPSMYMNINVIGSINLIKLCKKYKVNFFIYSSSASVYGNSQRVCKEDYNNNISPISPYACSKYTVELLLKCACSSNNSFIEDDNIANNSLKGVSLRYFNAVGAHSVYNLGDFSKLSEYSNLFRIIDSIAVKGKNQLTIFGKDYDTIDGTPVRDYIHVEDLAEGHIFILKYLESLEKENKNKTYYDVFNLGSGKGYSVLEVVNNYNKVNNININYNISDIRREGDIDSIIADCSKLKNLGWTSKKTIDDMCVDSFRYICRNNSIK